MHAHMCAYARAHSCACMCAGRYVCVLSCACMHTTIATTTTTTYTTTTTTSTTTTTTTTSTTTTTTTTTHNNNKNNNDNNNNSTKAVPTLPAACIAIYHIASCRVIEYRCILACGCTPLDDTLHLTRVCDAS